MQQELPMNAICLAQTPTPLADSTLIPAPIAAWLHAEHEQLAMALARAATDSDSIVDGEAMLAVDDLPDATKRFLWRGIQRHHPALSALVRDPLAAELRETFGARLHLRLVDLVRVICASAPMANSN